VKALRIESVSGKPVFSKAIMIFPVRFSFLFLFF